MRWQEPASALALLALCSCSSESGNDFSQYFKVVRQSLVAATGHAGVSLQQAAAIPYASMGWRLNDGAQNIIVLATDNTQDQVWTSAAHITFQTQQGRVRHTVGLPHDMTAWTSKSGNELSSPALALKGSYAEQYTADFADIGAYGVVIACQAESRGTQNIVILGKSIRTGRIDETCNSPTLRWRFRNSYWVDLDSGFTWRARQHVHPAGDILETEVFRPPG